ncbi:unnamed protein product [Candida verbasci]|uniref:Phosphatidylinositol 4-kinase n=1 Tax=Candida verbasci TaxID=1227364 RepID=A0A9W4TUU4_9ASCO|nr:unnamed protein product [Candida verbasci]
MDANDSIDPFQSPPRPKIPLSNSWHEGKLKKSNSVPNTPSGNSNSMPNSRRASLDETNFNFTTRFRNSIIIPVTNWTKSKPKTVKEDKYIIEYSVFRYNGKQINNEVDLESHSKLFNPKGITDTVMSDQQFRILISQVERIFEVDHIYPQRITTGSSGSYFIFNIDITLYKAGIFKPKDEEPYGPLSPKWTKWLHRTFFPCCFGRSCLIPNLGYVSECAAYILDKNLRSFIVPHTEIVKLKAPTFYYKFWDRSKPAKIGSFQIFLNNYINADIWFKIYPIPIDKVALPDSSDMEVDINECNYVFHWSKSSMLQFQKEIEKLVILDYLMRNTDRGLENFMIKIEWEEVKTNDEKKLVKPFIKMGAIDSGLSFPWKHPNEWRSFPFGWLFLPLSIIGQPFTQETRDHYLPLLTSRYWWSKLVPDLKAVFMKDQDFKERMWNKQLAVLKGQAFNIIEILKLPYAGPLELTRRENLLVFDDIMYLPDGKDIQCSNYSSYQQNELTPLLNPIQEIINDNEDGPNIYESGYERISRTNPDSNATTQHKKVIIERLVKETSKPPVFTWC